MPSNIRTSCVDSIRINAISNSGVCIVGDAFQLAPQSKIFAVARQWPIFNGQEGDLSQYPLFQRPIPLPAISEPVTMNIHHHSPINIGRVTVLGVTASAIVQIGSSQEIDMESRIKHIRHFLSPPIQEKEH